MPSYPEIKQLKQYILEKASRKNYDMELVKKALKQTEELHSGQFRKSGEPYFIHPLSVAKEVIDLDLGTDAVCAALLHDTIEDCGVDKEYIERNFNSVIATLVEGVTKIDALAHNSNKRYTELLNLRKLIISFAEDVRVLLIKLADRLNNMRTVDALKPEKQVVYADETLKVYVPLAEYIGIGKWKRELEDIAFRKKEPELHKRIAEKIQNDPRIHDKVLEELIAGVENILSSQKIKYEKVYGRIKSIHSTYNKLEKWFLEGRIHSIENADISDIKDLIAISIILDADEIECYRVLGLIHANFEYSSKDFADYIAKPKPNGYRSLHTVVKFKDSAGEIQIKTAEMHEVNEFGPASHLAYKLSGNKHAQANNQFGWIKNLNLWIDKESNDEKFKVKAFEDKIFVITPKGRVIELKKGATPIDFAYMIHTEVGNKFIGAKVNDQIAKVDRPLENGDVVEILTSKTPKTPSLEWLKHARLNSTKQKIRHHLTLHERETNILKGKEVISEYVQKNIKLDWFSLDTGILRYLCGEFGAVDIDTLYIGIFYGNIPRKEVLKLLVKKLNLSLALLNDETEEKKAEKEYSLKNKRSQILIENDGDLEYKIAGCCKPIPGDEIIGLVTLREGLKIHRAVCPEIENIEAARKLHAVWNTQQIKANK